MNSTPTIANALQKLLLLALFGFLAVVLAGPVIALMFVVLSLLLVMVPFALVGMLLWLPFQAAVLGWRIDWDRVGAAMKAVAGGLYQAAAAVLSVAGRALAWVGRSLWLITHFVFLVLLDVIVGAATGGMLGVIGGQMHGDTEGRVPLAMLIGAGVGLIVGLLRSRGPKTALPPQPVPVLAPGVK